MRFALLLLQVLSFAFVALGWQWEFNTGALQCENLQMGLLLVPDKGTPPWSLLFVPTGSESQLRRAPVFTLNFPDERNKSQDVLLRYPTGTEFVVVGSDGAGFGTGGTSSLQTVLEHDGTDTCLSFLPPPFQWGLTVHIAGSCVAVEMSWNLNAVVGQPSFLGIVPSGKSFQIPRQMRDTRSGFFWRPDLPTDTTLFVVAGDERGPGSGGVRRLDMSQFPAPAAGVSCDNAFSTTSSQTGSSTQPSSAGGSTSSTSSPSPTKTGGTTGGTNTRTDSNPPGQPTETGGQNDDVNTDPKSKKNLGLIIGLVVAGVVGFIIIGLVAWYFWRRSETRAQVIDLTDDHIVGTYDSPLPEIYTPYPYMTQVVASSSSGNVTRSSGRNILTKSPPTEPVTVPILQHQDSGIQPAPRSDAGETRLEELPPAYSDIGSRRPRK